MHASEDLLYVRRSKRAQEYGAHNLPSVFAARAMPLSTMLGTRPGERLTSKEFLDRYPIILRRVPSARPLRLTTPWVLVRKATSPHKGTGEASLIVDASAAEFSNSPLKYLLHGGLVGAAPNAIVLDDGAVWTSRPVAEGEEIFADFGPGYGYDMTTQLDFEHRAVQELDTFFKHHVPMPPWFPGKEYERHGDSVYPYNPLDGRGERYGYKPAAVAIAPAPHDGRHRAGAGTKAKAAQTTVKAPSRVRDWVKKAKTLSRRPSRP
jgi:hypothetical protein